MLTIREYDPEKDNDKCSDFCPIQPNYVAICDHCDISATECEVVCMDGWIFDLLVNEYTNEIVYNPDVPKINRIKNHIERIKIFSSKEVYYNLPLGYTKRYDIGETKLINKETKDVSSK